MKSCGCSLVLLVLGAIVAIWLVFNIGWVWSILDQIPKLLGKL